MAEVKLPPFIESMSGKLGDKVYRTSRKTGKTYSSDLPKKSEKPPTEAQVAQQERFTLAHEYANRAKGEPVYVKRAKRTRKSAYGIAFFVN